MKIISISSEKEMKGAEAKIILCNLCNRSFESIQPLSNHLSNSHNVNKLQYYNTYLKRKDEGLCFDYGVDKLVPRYKPLKTENTEENQDVR